jgi:hypothetical protein
MDKVNGNLIVEWHRIHREWNCNMRELEGYLDVADRKHKGVSFQEFPKDCRTLTRRLEFEM